MNLTKKISLSEMAIGLMLASMLMFSVALAQTETVAETASTSADIPPELVALAQDLNCQTSAECAEKFDANLEQGITLAQKYKIYTPEQEKVASTFKTEVLERLRTVSQDNFEEEILALANKILSEKPALARTMGVTRQTVNAAQTIVSTIKDAGVDIGICRKSPEDLSREQLIACVKAGNNLSSQGKSVGDYIPKENVKAGEAEQMLALENSLLAGEYPGLGKVSVEQAGQICLKSGSESVTDCDRIAQKFFGNEGVKHLQEARQQTTRIKEYYTQGIERMELVTPDGQKLIGKGAIRNACDRAFEDSNLGLARACGNFAVKNGYATQEEIEDGLKLLETFSQKAEGVNFDDCRFNPESCKEFLPDEFRSQFDSQFEIFRIMSESIGFDPMRCENTYDPDIGKRCLEGAKKALSQVEEIAKNSPEARRIVNEIKSHISEGERMTERRNEFNQDSSRGGMAGPGGCRGPEECFKYCNQPANSAECIAFGAKSQIFEQNTVVEKFNRINEQFNTPFPGQYPGFTGPGTGFDYIPYPNRPEQVDPGFNQYPYPYPPQQPVGPSPECMAAISSGDFVRAKTACSSTTVNYPRPIVDPFPVCPSYAMPSPCPEGQMRQAASDARGCMAYGACTVMENYKPIDTTVKPCLSGQYWDGRSCVANPIQDTNCPMMPTVSSCPAGQEKYQTYSSPGCGVYYGCRDTTTKTPCPSGQYWNGTACVSTSPATNCDQAGGTWDSSTNYCQMPKGGCPSGQYWDGRSCVTQTIAKECPSGMWWNETSKSCSYTAPTVGSCNYSTQYWKASNSTCQPRTNCADTANSEYNSSECQSVRGSTTPVGSGCGSFITQATCQASPGCGWANGACGGNMTTTTTCPAGQYWYYPPAGGPGSCMSNTTTSSSCPAGYHSHGESGGFCMNDQENYSGTCYNASGTSKIACPQQTYVAPTGCGTNMTQASCTTSSSGCSWQNNACMPVSSTSNTCPAGQYWYYPPAGGPGSCMSNTTSSTTCPAGQHWYTPSSGAGYCVTDTATTATGTCPAGQHWYTPSSGAGYCMSDTTSSTTCPAGQSWYTPPSGGAGYCMSMPSGTSTACSSGQYWNGTACVSSTTSTTYPTPSTTYPTPSTTYPTPAYMTPATTYPTPTTTYTYPTPTESYPTPSTTYPTPSTTYPTPAYMTPPTSMILCSQAGGSWTGAACNLAENTSAQKAYLNYFQKQFDSLLAQPLKAFR